MEDCLTLILNHYNGIYINKRYYNLFISVRKEWLYKCKVVFYLVHKYKEREYLKNRYVIHYYDEPLINRIAAYNTDVNILYNSLSKCDMCEEFKDQCSGRHRNAADYF